MKKIFFFALLLSALAYADPALKTGVVGLSASSVNKPLFAGDEVELDVVVNEAIGAPNAKWDIDTALSQRWVPMGGVSLDRESIKEDSIIGTNTKFTMRGILTGSGDLSVQNLKLLNADKSIAVQVNGAVATKVGTQLTDKDKQEKNWLLNPVSFGGWNYLAIGALALVLVVLLGFFIFWIVKTWREKKSAKKLDPAEAALAKLMALEAFAQPDANRTSQEWKKFSYETAHTLRHFCHELYNFHAEDLTDRELLQALTRYVIPQKFMQQLKSILEGIDGVRYGQKMGDISLAAHVLVEAKNFVEALYAVEMERRNPKKESDKK